MRHFAVGITLSLFIAAFGAAVSAPQQAQANGALNQQINAIRADANLPALKRNTKLDAAAKAHAADMDRRNFFAHKGSNGSLPDQRVTRAGYRWCTVAENIANGYRDGAKVIEGWRNSQGHYRNIVSRKAKEYGLANVGDVWVMVVAARKC